MTLNSENIFDQHLSIWRLLLLNSSSSWDFCWMQSTQNENDSAGILSLSLSLFWCFLCDSLSLFDMNMFPFTFWARFSETVSLSILNQKNFYSCFLSVLLSQSSSQYALFLFLVHISLLCPNLTNTTLFAPISQITLWSSSSSTLPSFLPAKANTGSLQRLYDPALTSAALSHVHIWNYLGNTNTNVIQRSFVQLLSYRILTR